MKIVILYALFSFLSPFSRDLLSWRIFAEASFECQKNLGPVLPVPFSQGLLQPFVPGGLLDLILDGDVPSRFQKHTHSLYQFFQNVYPTLYQFFKNIYPNLYQFSENAYPILYQLQKLRKSIPFLIPKS